MRPAVNAGIVPDGQQVLHTAADNRGGLVGRFVPLVASAAGRDGKSAPGKASRRARRNGNLGSYSALRAPSPNLPPTYADQATPRDRELPRRPRRAEPRGLPDLRA